MKASATGASDVTTQSDGRLSSPNVAKCRHSKSDEPPVKASPEERALSSSTPPDATRSTSAVGRRVLVWAIEGYFCIRVTWNVICLVAMTSFWDSGGPWKRIIW